jgi:hypothetical protein
VSRGWWWWLVQEGRHALCLGQGVAGCVQGWREAACCKRDSAWPQHSPVHPHMLFASHKLTPVISFQTQMLSNQIKQVLEEPGPGRQ